MTLGRNKCVMKGASQKHEEFIDRIRKSLYFGGGTLDEDIQVSRPLAEYASELFSEPHKGHSLHRLNRVAAGSVHTTPCSLIMALIYLDRLNATDPCYVRRITPQELFIVSMMISTKFYTDYDDEFYLSDWAEEGNITADRLKQLEKEFLSAIDWNIYISSEQFFKKLANVERTLALREGLKRGWLTYTELVQMLPSFTTVKFLLNNITVMAVSYTAGVMTIAGAFFLASQLPMSSLQRNAKVSCNDASTDDTNTNLLKDSTILPAASNLRLTAEQQQQLNITANSPASLTTSVSIDIANNSYAAFNVEAELLKLERQYHEEALLEELRRRNNEIVVDTHQNFFNILEKMAHHRASDSYKNWLTLKDEYSDEFKKLHDLSALQALTTSVQRLFLIMAFIYGQRRQFKQLRMHFMPPNIRGRGHKMDHAAAAFLLLQIFIVYKACGSEIFKTTIFLKEFLL